MLMPLSPADVPQLVDTTIHLIQKYTCVTCIVQYMCDSVTCDT